MLGPFMTLITILFVKTFRRPKFLTMKSLTFLPRLWIIDLCDHCPRSHLFVSTVYSLLISPLYSWDSPALLFPSYLYSTIFGIYFHKGNIFNIFPSFYIPLFGFGELMDFHLPRNTPYQLSLLLGERQRRKLSILRNVLFVLVFLRICFFKQIQSSQYFFKTHSKFLNISFAFRRSIDMYFRGSACNPCPLSLRSKPVWCFIRRSRFTESTGSMHSTRSNPKRIWLYYIILFLITYFSSSYRHLKCHQLCPCF